VLLLFYLFLLKYTRQACLFIPAKILKIEYFKGFSFSKNYLWNAIVINGVQYIRIYMFCTTLSAKITAAN
jgi:hypothetical protein